MRVVVQRCLAALVAALAAPAMAVTLRDDRGTVHHFERAPARIVTLVPSLTETVCALGGCARLVGVDRYSNSPPQVRSLPRLGGLDDAQVERIVALRPDVVLAPPSVRVIDRLQALGLPVVVIDARRHADVQRALGLVATLMHTPGEAARAWQRIEMQFAQAAARVPEAMRGRSVYFEVDPAPYAAGAGTFIGETLQRLGVRNAVGAELGPFPRLSPEYVVRLRPDVVIAERRSLQEMPRRPGWAALDALRLGRSCGYDLVDFEVLVRPGPQMGEGALRLADCFARIAQEERR